MKGLVYRGPRQVSVETIDDPRIEDPKVALVRITTTNICGSDLHMYEGRTSVEEGKVLGHENMGVVADVGAAVERIRVGDRVSVPGGYQHFDDRVDGWTKVLLHPAAA